MNIDVNMERTGGTVPWAKSEERGIPIWMLDRGERRPVASYRISAGSVDRSLGLYGTPIPHPVNPGGRGYTRRMIIRALYTATYRVAIPIAAAAPTIICVTRQTRVRKPYVNVPGISDTYMYVYT